MELTIFQSFYGYLDAESHQELGIRVQSSNPAKRNAKKVKTEVRYGSSAKIFSWNRSGNLSLEQSWRKLQILSGLWALLKSSVLLFLFCSPWAVQKVGNSATKPPIPSPHCQSSTVNYLILLCHSSLETCALSQWSFQNLVATGSSQTGMQWHTLGHSIPAPTSLSWRMDSK